MQIHYMSLLSTIASTSTERGQAVSINFGESRNEIIDIINNVPGRHRSSRFRQLCRIGK
jgi:hypothetical protein